MVDALIVWPNHIDYPLFRKTLDTYKAYFNAIYVALSPSNVSDRDVTLFLRAALPYVRFLIPQPIKSDWRDNAIHELLLNSTADTVLFLEQDFLMREGLPFEFAHNFGGPFLGFKEGERIHPAYALIKRALIERTSRDFAAHPELGYDHFGKFFVELKSYVTMRFIDEFGFDNKYHYYHLNGLTQNFHCYHENQPFYRPDEFLTYVDSSLSLPVVHCPEFRLLCEEIKVKHGAGNLKFIKQFFQ